MVFGFAAERVLEIINICHAEEGVTRDGRGTLKTMFGIEMDSDETQMTRLGMMLSQSCTRLKN